jgi:hypothetical protein
MWSHYYSQSKQYINKYIILQGSGEWVIDCWLTSNEQFSAIPWREQVTFRRDKEEFEDIKEPLWYLLFFFDVRIPITSLISSVLPRCTDSYYLFDIFCSSSMYGFLLPLWYLLFFFDVRIPITSLISSRKNRRYQRGNRNPYIEEEQKISKR